MTYPTEELDRLTRYMPLVVRSAGLTEWERKFCASIIAKGRSGKFRPSDKQAHVMRRLVTRFQDETMRDDPDDVLDADDHRRSA